MKELLMMAIDLLTGLFIGMLLVIALVALFWLLLIIVRSVLMAWRRLFPDHPAGHELDTINLGKPKGDHDHARINED